MHSTIQPGIAYCCRTTQQEPTYCAIEDRTKRRRHINLPLSLNNIRHLVLQIEITCDFEELKHLLVGMELELERIWIETEECEDYSLATVFLESWKSVLVKA